MKAKNKPVPSQAAYLELNSTESLALDQWRSRFINANSAGIARWAIAFALIHPEQFDRWVVSVDNYCAAEDIDLTWYLRSRIAARYRGLKLKLLKGAR